jgi:hypothetical protein
MSVRFPINVIVVACVLVVSTLPSMALANDRCLSITQEVRNEWRPSGFSRQIRISSGRRHTDIFVPSKGATRNSEFVGLAPTGMEFSFEGDSILLTHLRTKKVIGWWRDDEGPLSQVSVLAYYPTSDRSVSTLVFAGGRSIYFLSAKNGTEIGKIEIDPEFVGTVRTKIVRSGNGKYHAVDCAESD